jgi:membrane protein
VGALRRASRFWTRARRRYGWLDHLARAGQRYADVQAGRLAAALTYYAFFAAFGLSGIGFAILGWVMRGNVEVTETVQRYVDTHLVQYDVSDLGTAATRIGLIAIAGLLVTGWFWVDGVRAAVRRVWLLDEQPGSLPVRVAVDLAVLAALGVLLLVSIGIAVAVSAGFRWLVVDAAGVQGGPTRFLISALGGLLGLAVNTVLAMALLTGLPRLKLSLRRVVVPALLVAVSLELLKTVGRLYFERSMANPAYQAVATAVGLLLFLNLLNQAVLYAAALTATSYQGEAVDLATGSRSGAAESASGGVAEQGGDAGKVGAPVRAAEQ